MPRTTAAKTSPRRRDSHAPIPVTTPVSVGPTPLVIPDKVRAGMERVIDQGKAKAAQVMEKLMMEAEDRQSFLLPTPQLHVAPFAAGLVLTPVGIDRKHLTPIDRRGTYGWEFNEWSQGQLMDAYSIRKSFAGEVLSWGEPGARVLARLIEDPDVREHATRNHHTRLVRTVGGVVRGLLTDQYHLIDYSQVVDGWRTALAQYKDIIITDAGITDTQYTLSAIHSQIVSPPTMPGEFLVVGTTVKASDYGDGAVNVLFNILRPVCINGMVGWNLFRQSHWGARQQLAVGESFQISEKTAALQEQLALSKMQDAVEYAFSEEVQDKVLDAWATAAREHIDPAKEIPALVRRGVLDEKDAATVERLMTQAPEDIAPVTKDPNSALRFANILSWIANLDTTSAQQRLALQAEAGTILPKLDTVFDDDKKSRYN